MDEAGSLSGLEGQDWAKWIRRLGRDRPEEDLKGSGGAGPSPAASPKPSAHCKRLPYQDHLLFGHCPEVDPFVAAVCEFCGAIVKIAFLQQHIAQRHDQLLKPKLKVKSEPIVAPVSRERPPPPPPAPLPPQQQAAKVAALLPVLGKQSILVAAAARFAEAPLSPHETLAVVPPVAAAAPKPRKRGRNHRAAQPDASSTAVLEKRRRVDTTGGYNPDLHCGVWNEQTKTNCLRALTCRIHSLVLKRAVPMRTRLFDDLLAQHKHHQRVKKEAPSSLDEDSEVLVEDDDCSARGVESAVPSAERPNGLTITGSFARVEISLDEFPVAPSEFLPLSFPRLSASTEITKKPLLSVPDRPKQRPPEKWPEDSDPPTLRHLAPKPLMVCNASNLRKFGGYVGVCRSLQVLRHKFQCLVYTKENASEEIRFDYLGFPPASVELVPPCRPPPPPVTTTTIGRLQWRAVVARRVRQAKAKYRLQLVRHRKHKHCRPPVIPDKPNHVHQQLVATKKRKIGSYKENSSLNGTKPGESLLVSNRAAVGLMSSRPHSALGDAAAAHPSTASTVIGAQVDAAETLLATKCKGGLIRLSDLADGRNHKSSFANNQNLVTVQQVPRVLASQMMPVPGETSNLKLLPAQLYSFSKKDDEKI